MFLNQYFYYYIFYRIIKLKNYGVKKTKGEIYSI